MNQKTLFYILIAFIVFFIVTQLVTTLTQRPPFEIAYYRSRMEYDYTGQATFTATAGLFFKDKSKQQQYINQYQQASLSTFKGYFDDVSKKVGRQIDVISMNSTVTERSGILEVLEIARLSNVASVENGVVDTSLKDITIYSVGDSEIVVVVPEDAQILSMEPTPTKVVLNEIYWQPGQASMVFPKVVFKKGDQN
ncbi:MAG: DUF4897 domain-containing protein [Pseudothermotoga sp.]